MQVAHIGSLQFASRHRGWCRGYVEASIEATSRLYIEAKHRGVEAGAQGVGAFYLSIFQPLKYVIDVIKIISLS